MAQLPNTELETHPTGTTGLNEILSGNWERIDELFDPALGSGDAGFLAFARALLRDALGTMAAGETIAWNGSKFARRAPVEALTYAASVALPFGGGNGAPLATLALTGDVTLTTTGLFAGGRLEVVVSADASSRAFTFPGGWKWIGGAAPASIAASKTGILTLNSTSTADAGVLARWTVEP